MLLHIARHNTCRMSLMGTCLKRGLLIIWEREKNQYKYLLICSSWINRVIYSSDIFSNVFVFQENIRGSNASKRMVIEFQILFIKEKIGNSLSCHASKMLQYFVLVGLSDIYLNAQLQCLVPQCIPITRRITLTNIRLRPTE